MEAKVKLIGEELKELITAAFVAKYGYPVSNVRMWTYNNNNMVEAELTINLPEHNTPEHTITLTPIGAPR